MQIAAALAAFASSFCWIEASFVVEYAVGVVRIGGRRLPTAA